MKPLSLEQVLQQLQELTQGLLYLSESEYPVEVVHYKVPSTNELTTDQMLALVNQLPSELVEIRDLHYFFRNVTKPVDETTKAEYVAKRFQVLQAFLEQHLQDLKVYRIGKGEVLTYVLGRIENAPCLGVKTTVVESF